jgi:2-haloacid dehalogenase
MIEGFDPEAAVIVGDSLSSDIKGGKVAGIKTVWFNPKGLENKGEICPDFEIRTLAELPSVLEKM